MPQFYNGRGATSKIKYTNILAQPPQILLIIHCMYINQTTHTSKNNPTLNLLKQTNILYLPEYYLCTCMSHLKEIGGSFGFVAWILNI